MPNFCEAGRQDMHQETPDKLFSSQRHLFPTAAVPVVPPFERNVAALKLENSVIGDGHPVGVTPKILHHASHIFKRRFAVNHPFFMITLIQHRQFYAEKLLLEQRQKFASEFSGQYLHRQEELFSGRKPFAQLGKAPSRNNAVYMWVEAEILSPCVEHSGVASGGAKILLVRG